MNSLAISGIVFACTVAGSLCGMRLRANLPNRELSANAKEVLNLGMGLIATMTALVLGLLIASAKDSSDEKRKELTDFSANLILLDRTLAHYGPETAPVRDVLRRAVSRIIDQTWSRDGTRSRPDPSAAGAEGIYDQIQLLSPKSDGERLLQSQAISIGLAIAKTRWLMFEQESDSVSTLFLAVLVAWLTVLFIGFGLCAPPDPSVMPMLLVCAAVVSSAILLILEMYKPFQGLIQISDAPLRAALTHLGGQ